MQNGFLLQNLIVLSLSKKILFFSSCLHKRYGAHLSIFDDISQIPTASIDIVIATFLLCSAPEEKLLSEIRRILVRPYGRYFFVEHVKSDSKVYAQAQSAIAPIQRALADNCDPTKQTEDILRSQFALSDVTHTTLSGHFPLDPVISGIATPLDS
mmetsp:Transcript_20252/g.30897  ORF Transcript_20252/g.30897 Transcript_20252/m.30897 type:complete len:155 (-) Transcript_20252:29-493(-)